MQRIRLEALCWYSRHENTDEDFQMELRNLDKLAHRDTAKALCIYTDASDARWSGVVMQTGRADLKEQLEDQKHEPLAFLRTVFKGAEEFWTNLKKNHMPFTWYSRN